MMKKVKKKDLPKYKYGTPMASPNSRAQIKAAMKKPPLTKINTRAGVAPPTGSGGGSGSSSGGGFGGFNVGAISAAGTYVGKSLMDLAGVDDNSQAGVTLNSSMKGAELGGSIMPGWGHLIGGVAGAALGAFKKGSVDPNTGEVQMGGIFGRSKTSLYSEANRIKNSIQARERTLDIQMEYMNDPNVEIQPDVLAAEGGIMRKPVKALVSKGELIYDPTTKKLRQVPGSKGKPNKADDVYVRLYEGDVVVSNSPTMLMANGKTPALNLERMVTVDKKKKNNNLSEGTTKAREAIIKKVVNWQEANKTEPQEYAKFYKGTGEKGVPNLNDMFLYRQPDGKFVMLDINGNRYDVPEMMLPYIQGDEHGYWFGPQTGVAPSAGKWNGAMNFAKQILNSKNVAKLKNTMTRVLPKGAKSANINGSVRPVTGTSPEVLGKPKTAQEAAQMAKNERTLNMWKQLTSKGGVPQKTLEGPQTWATARGSSNLWENPMALQSGDDIASAITTAYYLNKGLPTALGVSAMLGGAGTFLAYEATKDKQSAAATMPTNTDKSTVVTALENPVEPIRIPAEATTENEKKKAVAPKKSSINKPSSGKKTSRTSQEVKPIEINQTGLDWAKQEASRAMSQYAPSTTKAVAPDLVSPKIDPTETVEEAALPGYSTTGTKYTGSNWRDGLYRMTVLSQPLWDRAEAEPVQYTVPGLAYRPVNVNELDKVRAINENYALDLYNASRLNTNTGQGLAYASQAATNRMKQLSDVYSWKTNAQNELIGRNVDTYNRWSENYADIMNNVYNKTAANRAAARNINRQNRAAALRNYGQMLRDDKQNTVGRMKFTALKPAILSTYEDTSANDIYKWYKELFG